MQVKKPPTTSTCPPNVRRRLRGFMANCRRGIQGIREGEGSPFSRSVCVPPVTLLRADGWLVVKSGGGDVLSSRKIRRRLLTSRSLRKDSSVCQLVRKKTLRKAGAV